MTIWFSRKINGIKKYCSKSISIRFHLQHWRMIKAWNNGAKKGRMEDTCFDFNIHFLGIFFSYTNWDYNRLSKKAKIYAKRIHKKVNHRYNGHSYKIHLTMASKVFDPFFVHLIPSEDYEVVLASIWLHDTIEDCRLTYNDIKKEFGDHVAEIVYAVTNEKGKTRKERANNKYYEGIRYTTYASFVKCCDRIANLTYSKQSGSKMYEMYKKEFSDFKSQLFSDHLKPMFDYMETF